MGMSQPHVPSVHAGLKGKIMAVIFDFDGTLVSPRSDKSGVKLLAKSINKLSRILGLNKRLGLILSCVGLKPHFMHDDPFYKLVGAKALFLQASRIFVRILRPIIFLIVRAYVENSFDHSVYSDAEPTIFQLKREGYRLGIISDADIVPGMKSRKIRRLWFLRFFDVVVVAGEDTRCMKPDPEPFLLASSKLVLSPRCCIYVGDRPDLDVVGAKAAGFLTVLICRNNLIDYSNKLFDSRPDFIIRTLSQLLEIL